MRIEMLEGGLTRLVFTRLRVEVYLKGNAGVAINTYGRTFRTSAELGPCSPARALTAAYGGRLRKLPTSGPVSLYRLGNLVFRVVSGRIEAVTLGKGQLAVLVAGNSTPPDCRSSQSVLRFGSRGLLVARWQTLLDQWLRESNYPAVLALRRQLGGALARDGVFGIETERATHRFQREVGLRPTGVVGLRSWERWISAHVSCCGAGLPRLERGDDNAYVGWWQIVLDRWQRARGLPEVAVDGLFGRQTEIATERFQRAVAVPPTGVVDRSTWQALKRTPTGIGLP